MLFVVWSYSQTFCGQLLNWRNGKYDRPPAVGLVNNPCFQWILADGNPTPSRQKPDLDTPNHAKNYSIILLIHFEDLIFYSKHRLSREFGPLYIWRFPEMGLPLFSSSIFIGFSTIFHQKNQPFLGIPMTVETSDPSTALDLQNLRHRSTAGVRCTSLVEPCWKRLGADGQRWKKGTGWDRRTAAKTGICSWFTTCEKLGLMERNLFPVVKVWFINQLIQLIT